MTNTVQHPVPYADLERLIRLATTGMFIESAGEPIEQTDADAKMLLRYRDMLGMNEHE